MAGVIRFAYIFTAPTSPANVCVQTGHVLKAGDDPDQTDVDTVLAALDAAHNTAYNGNQPMKNIQNVACTLQEIHGQIIQPTPASSVTVLPVARAGVITGDMLPPQISIVLSMRTAFAGRSFRGRMYLCGMNESHSDANGGVTGSAQVIASEVGENLRERIFDIAGGEFRLGVWSRVLQEGREVTVVRVGNRFDTQRRRKVPGETYIND